MIDEKEVKKTYWEGYNAYKNHKVADKLEGSTGYVPPLGHEEAYKAGWEAAERDWDKESKEILEFLKTGGIENDKKP